MSNIGEALIRGMRELCDAIRGYRVGRLPQVTCRTCSGCNGTFREDRLSPVSGDFWLCRDCFDRWYQNFDTTPPAREE